MIIAATSDIHAPNYFHDFIQALDNLKIKPDIFLLAGDVIERGEAHLFEQVREAISKKVKCPIIACFGNNEFIPDSRERIRNLSKNMKILDDDACMLEVGSDMVGIVGTIGSLDNPTRWQLQNIPTIRRIYEERIGIVEKFLNRMSANIKIVLMHYVPTYKTLVGELETAYGGLGSFKYEEVLKKKNPTVVIHGHSHKGTKFAMVDSVPVFNVAFPLNNEIVIIDTNDLREM